LSGRGMARKTGGKKKCSDGKLRVKGNLGGVWGQGVKKHQVAVILGEEATKKGGEKGGG